MATKYWVGGNGNWSSLTNWRTTSGGAVVTTAPGSADAAVLDVNSSTNVVTVDSNITIQTLTCTGFTGTLAFGTNTISLNSTGTIFTGATTMTVTGTPQVICTDSSATTRTITPGAVTEANSISFRITAGTGALGITTGSVRDLDFTDGTNPTGYAGAFSNSTTSVYGNFKASTSGMTRVPGTGTIVFAATSGTKTVNTASVTFDCPFTFNGVGGTFQLASALTSGATRTCTLTAGTLDLASYTLTTGLFASANSNTRVFAFGTGKMVLTGTNTVVYTTTTGTGLTMTGTRTVEVTGVGLLGDTRTISGAQTAAGGVAANAANFYIQAGADTIALGTASRVYGTLNFTGFSGSIGPVAPQIYGDLVFSSAMTVNGGTSSWGFLATTAQTITSNGKTIDNDVTFNGIGGSWAMQDALTSGSTRTCTLTAGTLDLNGFTLTTGFFSGTGSGVRKFANNTASIIVTGNSSAVVNFGTTTNLTADFTPVFELNYSGSVGTRTVTWGLSNLLYVPVILVTAGSDIVTTGGTTTVSSLFFSSSFTGTLGNATRNIYGNLTLSSGMATPSSGSLVTTFNGIGSQSIITAGKTLDFPVTFNGIGGTWAMQDALTLGSTRALTITNGTLQLKSGTTNTVGSFATSGTNQKFLSATTPGSQAILSQASGTDSVSYLTIQDSNATGGAVFQAFTSNFNVDAGNNTGWKFSNNGGNFLMFF